MAELYGNTTDLQQILDAVHVINEETTAQSALIDELMDALDGKAVPDDGAVVPSGTINITENGTYDVTSYASAEVNVVPEEPVLQDKTVTPTTSQQTVTADDGYDGLNVVTVNAMPTATQATPSISVSNSGLITASATQSEGYVEEGTKSATRQLPTKGTTTIIPSDSVQTAVPAGTFVTGDIKVAAMESGDTYLYAEASLSVSGGGMSGRTFANMKMGVFGWGTSQNPAVTTYWDGSGTLTLKSGSTTVIEATYNKSTGQISIWNRQTSTRYVSYKVIYKGDT